MGTCEACGKEESVNFVTVTVTVFGPKTTKRKTVQFWLGESCEIALRQVMAQDTQQRQRIAWRLTQEPQLFSQLSDMHNRRRIRASAA